MTDERIAALRECAGYLRGPHGGDREALCLEKSAHATLALIGDILAARGAPAARGYKDACDKLVEHAGVPRDLADTLKDVLDVADRMPQAWSTVRRGDLDRARRE